MTDETTDLQARVKVLEDALRVAQVSIATFIGVHGYPTDSGACDVLNEVTAALAASQPADPVANAGCRQPVKVKPQEPAPVTPAEDAITKGETACQMLDRLGMDGAKWAAEFRTTALRLGYSDMDEGWLIGWFCNAIMAGHDRAQSPDAGKMVAPMTPAKAARIVGKAIDEGHEPFRLAVNAAFREINCDGHVASVARVALALEAALRAIGEDKV